jgi:hypothetical protein
MQSAGKDDARQLSFLNRAGIAGTQSQSCIDIRRWFLRVQSLYIGIRSGEPVHLLVTFASLTELPTCELFSGC